MDDEKSIDICAFDFERWIKFVFDHPVEEYPHDKWYWNSSDTFIVSDPQHLIKHFTQLCRLFPEVVSRYTIKQVDQGIWFLLSDPIQIGNYLAETSVSSAIKIACVRSMYEVYANYVAKADVEVMENCFDMWWDLICHNFWGAVRVRDVDVEAMIDGKSIEGLHSYESDVNYEHLPREDKLILDEMLETLMDILALKDSRCESYALHGLGHLHHPLGKIAVQNYIDQNRNSISKEGLDWVEACRDGKVM